MFSILSVSQGFHGPVCDGIALLATKMQMKGLDSNSNYTHCSVLNDCFVYVCIRILLVGSRLSQGLSGVGNINLSLLLLAMSGLLASVKKNTLSDFYCNYQAFTLRGLVCNGSYLTIYLYLKA